MKFKIRFFPLLGYNLVKIGNGPCHQEERGRHAGAHKRRLEYYLGMYVKKGCREYYHSNSFVQMY